MDIFASLTQTTSRRGDGNVDAVVALVEGAPSLLGEEFVGLTEISPELAEILVPDEISEDDDQDSLTEGADILAEIIDKMTGVTAAVAEPKKRPATDAEKIATVLLAGAEHQPDLPPPPQNLPELDLEQAALSDAIPEVEDAIPEPSKNGLAASGAEARLVTKPVGSPIKKPVDALGKEQISRAPLGHLAKPASPPPEGEVKQGVADDAPIDSLRNVVVSDVVSKPSIIFAAEPRAATIHLPAPEPVAPDSPRALAENRQVQFSPPALVRQISDTVVTMRDEMVEIRLSPEELGRVRMVLTGSDRAPHLTIWVDRPEVLEQMRRQGDHLLQQLRDQGMSGASLDFRNGRQTHDDPKQEQNFWEEQDSHQKDRPLMALPEASGRSLVTPLLSGRHGINIKV